MDIRTLLSTSFWVAALFQAGVITATLADSLQGDKAVYLSAASWAAYALSRTITKYRADFKRGYATTEFWVAIVSVAFAGSQAFNDHISNERAAAVAGAIAVVYKVSRALVTARLVDEG